MSEEKNILGVKEIAKLANVSIGTIDRVLHNRPGVAAKTKERVLAVLANHQYEPNLIGRALSKRKPSNFAALIPMSSVESAYWEAPLKGLYQAQQELSNYQVRLKLFLYDQNDRESFNEQVALLKERQIEGLVIAPTFLKESLELTQYCDAKGIVYSFLNSDLPTANSIAYFGPDLYQTGYLAGRLINMMSKGKGPCLLLHISKELELDHHLLRKEEGLNAYFEEKKIPSAYEVLKIAETSFEYVEQELNAYFENSEPQLIFVSNSRVSTVAKYIEKTNRKGVKLLGFDFLPENVHYLKEGIIDFLICHKPIEQGYNAMMSLFQKTILHKEITKIQFMPIDIICRENYMYYEN